MNQEAETHLREILTEKLPNFEEIDFEISRGILETTLNDIARIRGFELPTEQLNYYWLRYKHEVPLRLRGCISDYIHQHEGAKVWWIMGNEVRIDL